MSNNTTSSVLSKTEMTYEQLVASNLTKLLYLINGTGRDRDRTIQLSTLHKWILEGVSDTDKHLSEGDVVMKGLTNMKVQSLRLGFALYNG